MLRSNSPLSRLKQKYHDFNKELGRTGAGLRPEDIQDGSDLHNLIGRQLLSECNPIYAHNPAARLSVDFPYWKRLHGFWRTIPTFNPYTQSAEYGQDLAAMAREFVTEGKKEKGKQRKKELDDSEGDNMEVQSRDDMQPHDDVPASPLASPVVTPRLFGSMDAVSVASRSIGLQSRSVSRSVSRGRTSSQGKSRGFNPYGTFNTGSSGSTEADDDDGMSTLVELTSKKLD